MFLNVISRLTVVIALIGVGFVLDKRRIVSREALQSLGTIVINVMMPALIFSAMMTQMNRESIMAGWALPLLGAMTFGMGAVVGWALSKAMRISDHEKKNTVIYLLTINNYGYLTLPVAYMLFGERGIALLFLHNLGCHLVFWTYGVWLLSGGKFSLESLRPLVNFPLITLLVSIALPLAGAQRYVPQLVVEICDILGKGAIPLIMLVIGSTLAEIEFRRDFFNAELAWITVCRLLVVPVIVMLVLAVLPISALYRNIACVVAVMPAASITPLFTKTYGGDTSLAVKCVFITTLASAATMPVLLSLFLSK
ncbi:MAG TPA: AEC family transporter [bacterium]|nr:AEC family transporter [bacterium]